MLFNQQRALDYMRQYGLDALVATSPVNVCYFTDYYWWTDHYFKTYMVSPGGPSEKPLLYAIFPATGEPALIVDQVTAVNAAETWVKDIYVCGAPSFDYALPSHSITDNPYHAYLPLLRKTTQPATATEALLNALGKMGLSEARIGLEQEGLPTLARSQIAQALPQAHIQDASNLIRLIRMVKTEDELARLSRAATISEEAIIAVLQGATIGRPIQSLVQAYRQRVAAQGADFEHFAFGVNGLGLATELNYVLQAQDVLFIDVGCIYQHYYSDTGMTLAMRPLAPALLQRYEALVEAIDVAAAAMRPNVPTAAICNLMRETLDVDRSLISNPHGHSLGLEIREYPIIVRNNGLRIQDEIIDFPSDLLLKEGMVVNLEISVLMPTHGSLHIEQTYLVTATGGRPLIAQARSQPFIPQQS